MAKGKVASIHYGAKYLFFVSSRSVKIRGSSVFSVCIFLRNVCLFFNFLNDKMHNYVLFDIIAHFIVKKLNNKNTFLKKYTNWESKALLPRGSSAFSVCILFEENVFIFQFLNDEIHSYVVFDILWEKIVLEEHFWNLRLKAKNLQNLWDD